MSMPTDSPARLTGREYVDQYLTPLMAQFNVAREHVDVSYLAASSQVRLVSREFATTGEAGKFINEKTFGYLKQDLAAMFPAPLLYVGPWPVTYRTLVQSLRDTYGLVIEEGEFTLSNGLITLTPNPDTEITLEPPVTNGTFTFTATAASLRFRAGTAFRLLVHTSTGRVRLNALYDLPVVGRMAWLSNNADETAAVNTLVLSEGRSCVRDLFVRAYGYLPPESQIDTTFDFSNGRCVATVRGRDREVGTNAIGKFAGAATMEIERIKISSIISAPLNIDGTYSMSYEAFKRFMLNSFGLRIEDGEFYIGSDPLKQPLGPGSTVSFSPDANNQDRLIATSTSLRFLPEDGFTMRLIYAGEFVVIGQLPTYKVGDTIDFQYALRGGFPPYNLLDVVGLPSTVTLSQTGRLQGTAPAGNYPVIARYNDRMNSVAYLNDTIVIEVPDEVIPEPTDGFQMLAFRSQGSASDLTPLPIPEWTVEGNAVIADGPVVKGGKVTLDGQSYLRTGLHEIFDFGTEDFTLEFTVKYASLPNSIALGLFSTANAQLGDADTGLIYMYGAYDGLPASYAGTLMFGTTETGMNVITSSIPLPTGETKVSVTRRNGTDLHLFYNGQQAGAGTVMNDTVINFSKANGVTLGAVTSSTDVAKWTGEIYDMRVIKGLALYEPAPSISFDYDAVYNPTLFENGTVDLVIKIDPPLAATTAIPLTFSGDAQLDREFSVDGGGGSVTIPAGVGSHILRLRGIETQDYNGERYFNVTLGGGTGYQVIAPAIMPVSIRDAIPVATTWLRHSAGRVRTGRDVDIAVDPGLVYIPNWERMLGLHVDSIYMYRSAREAIRVANGAYSRGPGPWAAYSPDLDTVLTMRPGQAQLIAGPKTCYTVITSSTGLAPYNTPVCPMWIEEWQSFVAFDILTSTVIKSADGLTWTAMPAISGVINTANNQMYGMVWDTANQRLLVLANLGLTSNDGSQNGGKIVAYTAVDQITQPQTVGFVPYYLLENCFFYSEVLEQFVMTVWTSYSGMGMLAGLYTSTDCVSWTRIPLPSGVSGGVSTFTDAPDRNAVYVIAPNGKVFARRNGNWTEESSSNVYYDGGTRLTYHGRDHQLWTNASSSMGEDAVDIYVDRPTEVMQWSGQWEVETAQGPAPGQVVYDAASASLLVASGTGMRTLNGKDWTDIGEGALNGVGYLPDYAVALSLSDQIKVDRGNGYVSMTQTNRPASGLYSGDNYMVGFADGSLRYLRAPFIEQQATPWSVMNRAEFGVNSIAAFATREQTWTVIAKPTGQLWKLTGELNTFLGSSWTRIGTTAGWTDLCYANDLRRMFYAYQGEIHSGAPGAVPTVLRTVTGNIQGLLYIPDANLLVAWTNTQVHTYDGTTWNSYAAPFDATYGMAWMPHEQKLVAFLSGRSRTSRLFGLPQ